MPIPPQLTEHDDAVLIIARRLSRQAEGDQRLKGRFTMKQLRRATRDELGVSLPRSPKDGPVGRLLAKGEIVQYRAKERIHGAEHGNGTANVYRAPSVDRLHLGAILEFAKDQIRPAEELGNKAGRRGLSMEAREQVRNISAKQWAKARTMARHISYYLAPNAESEHEAFAAVAGPYLIFDPASGLEGDWQPLFDLILASRPKPSVTAEYVSSARLVMDLAANHGLLLREGRSKSYVVPTAWIDVQERWIEAAKRPGLAAVLGVNFLLGAIAEVVPDSDPEELTIDDTARVVNHVQNVLHSDRSLTTTQRTSIRRSIRRVMEAGLMPAVDVNGYDYRQRNRKAAWSSAISKAIARAVARRRRGRGLDWIDEDDGPGKPWEGRLADAPGYAVWKRLPFPVLADPDHPYSLARCVDFHTVTDHAAAEERKRRGFRALGTFPRTPPRETSSVSDVAWSEATTVMRLSSFALYLGWIQRHTSIDLATASMADLVRPDLLRAFKTAVATGVWSTPDQAQRALVAIGLVASPCLESEALKRGADDLADQFFEASCLATGFGERLEDGSWSGISLHTELKPAPQLSGSDGDDDGEDDEVGDEDLDSPDYTERVQRQRAKAARIEATYQHVLEVDWAYDGMVLLYEAACRAALNKLGVSSMAELSNRWTELAITRDTLITFRALSLWNVLLAAPMRTRTARHVTLKMVTERRDTLTLKVPARYTKVPANGPYMVQIRGGEGDGFDHELHLVYMGLVRPALLTSNRTGDTALDARHLWVNDWSRPRTARDQVSAATLNSMVRKVVELASAELGMTAEQRQALREVAQVHNFRHGVAGKLVNEELAERAAKLLHHNGTVTLRKVYAAGGIATSTGDIRAAVASAISRGDSGSLAQSTPDDLVARLKRATPEERDLIRRILGCEAA